MKKTLYDYCIESERESLLRQWHPTRNEPLSPKSVTYGSQKKVWWLCEKGHEWQAGVKDRSNGNGCPVCAGKKALPGFNDLATVHPELAKQWHPTKNKELKPTQIVSGAHIKVWWLCEKGHEWQAGAKGRSNGKGCPVCTGRTVLRGVNDLATVRPDLVKQWHPSKNGELMPEAVMFRTTQKVWWQCEKGHEWQTEVRIRTKDNTGCPVCSGRVVISGENDLASAFPDIAEQWHPEKNGELSPQMVTPHSNKKVWWQCEKGHEFCAVISSRADGKGCPYCAGQKVLPGFNDLATLEPELADQWHPELNGNLTPQMVTCGSQRRVWWKCQLGHVWKAVIYSRARNQRAGCPVCAGVVSEEKQAHYL